MTDYRIMIYCQDSLGLGHLRRATNIAWSVHRLEPRADLLIVADSPVAPFFSVPPTCDVVKLPTLVKVDAGRWKSPLDAVFVLDKVRSLRIELLRSIAEEFKPDAILIDHMAQGAMGELEPTLSVLRHRKGVHLVLGLRDILGDPAAIKAQWEREHVYDVIKHFYDQILIYGVREIFDLPSAHQFDEAMTEMSTFCGYVIPEGAAIAPRRSKGQPTALVMAGGGHDGDRIMTATVEALDHLAPSTELRFTIVTGPFLSSDRAAYLRRRAVDHHVEFERARTLTMADLAATDLVVSMCGYNTMAEVLALNRAAVVVPRLGPSLEQSIRARLFDDRQLIHAVIDQEIAPDHFARCIEAELAQDREAGATVATDGGRAAGLALLQRGPEVLELGV